MWELSASEQQTLREFLRWLTRDSLDYDLARPGPGYGYPDWAPLDTEDIPAVLAAYARWRAVLSEQG